MWHKSLTGVAQQKCKRQECDIRPCMNERTKLLYMLKYYDTANPSTYLPPRGMYKKVMYCSPGYNLFVLQHLNGMGLLGDEE